MFGARREQDAQQPHRHAQDDQALPSKKYLPKLSPCSFHDQPPCYRVQFKRIRRLRQLSDVTDLEKKRGYFSLYRRTRIHKMIEIRPKLLVNQNFLGTRRPMEVQASAADEHSTSGAPAAIRGQ